MSFAREPSPERTGQHAPPELDANTPEKQERQRHHEQAVQALNRIGVPAEFTDSIRWFTARHSKAYNGIRAYGVSESDLKPGEGQDSQEQQAQHEQQVRAHEMMHVYWSSLINPKLNLPLPADIDFCAVAEEHQDELAYWNITQNTAKKLTTLSDYTFHHHLPGSAGRAIEAINADPEKFLHFMQERSENSVPFAYGLASTLEYLEGITTDEFYATTGLGKSFEEGLVNYLSSAAIYGNDTAKWQKQDDERAMFYRDRLHQVFGGPEHVVAFLKENGVSAFVDRVRAEIQHLPAQESAEAMPKTETEKLLYAMYVLRAEGQGMWVDTKYVTPDYKAQCEVATRYLEDRLKTEGDQPSYLRDFWDVVESIPNYDGTTRTSTSEQWAFLPKGEDGRMASEQYVTELLQAYGLTTLEEILNQPSTFLRNLQTGASKTWTPLPQGAGFTDVPQQFEVVSVLEQAKEGTQLGELLKSLKARLILKLDPTDNYYTGDNQVTVKYQLVCHPDLAYPEEMESGIDTSRKKGDADDLEAPTELETLTALAHVLQGGTGKDMKRLGPDDVPPILRAKKNPPNAPGMEREVDTPEWVRNAMDLSVLFQYLTQHRELTDSEWETVARSLSRPQAQVLLELVRENQYALTGTSGQRETERQQTATRYREQERLRVMEG